MNRRAFIQRLTAGVMAAYLLRDALAWRIPEKSGVDDLLVGEMWTHGGFMVGEPITYDNGSGPVVLRITNITANTLTVVSA